MSSRHPDATVLVEEKAFMEGENVSKEGENVSKQGENVSKQGANVSKQTFPCQSCYKCYSSKRNLNYHIPKCKKVQQSLECDKCHELFNTRGSLSKHKQSCKYEVHISPEELRGHTDGYKQITNNNTTNNNTNYTTNNNTHNDHCTINNIQINIRPFGNENKDYITEEHARQCFYMGAYGVDHMLNKIFFDDDHPENHNVFMRSLKNSLVYVMNEKGEYECRSLYDAVDTMINASAREIMLKSGGSLCIQNPTQENIMLAQSIQSLPTDKRKIFRDKTKSKLVQRRDEEEKGELKLSQ